MGTTATVGAHTRTHQGPRVRPLPLGGFTLVSTAHVQMPWEVLIMPCRSLLHPHQTPLTLQHLRLQ